MKEYESVFSFPGTILSEHVSQLSGQEAHEIVRIPYEFTVMEMYDYVFALKSLVTESVNIKTFGTTSAVIPTMLYTATCGADVIGAFCVECDQQDSYACACTFV